MLESLWRMNYHKDLIEILLKAKAGAYAVGIFGPIFYFYMFKDSVPMVLLLAWTLIQITLFVFRMILNHKILINIDSLDHKTLNQYLKKYLLFIYANSIFWGLSSILALMYGTEIYIFILIAAIFGMTSGAMVTLTPIFHAIFAFLVNIIPLFIFSLVFIGATPEYYLTALLLSVYLIVTLPASYRVHVSIRDNILQKEKISSLNSMLEIRVKEAVLETKKKEKLLQQQTRLAQMGEMMSMIAHQWRQPLGAISGAVIGIQTKQASGKFKLEIKEDRDKFIHFIDTKHKNINEYVQILSHTIDDFRNFFKSDKEKELTSLTTPIKRALHIVESSMHAKNIQIEVLFENDDKILMYQNEMMQVILNILKNSEDNFIEKKTSDAKIFLTCKKKSSNYTITICDNGGGIPQSIITKIFDPYFSTKEEKNGTGLGLYMSKTIVEEHNHGKLSVENSNDGVCFIIQFGLKNE